MTAPVFLTVIVIVPRLATVGVAGVILNSVSLSVSALRRIPMARRSLRRRRVRRRAGADWRPKMTSRSRRDDGGNGKGGENGETALHLTSPIDFGVQPVLTPRGR